MSKDDEKPVGYKNPPKSGQIKKGERRNPHGRPKNSRNMKTIIRDLMSRPVVIVIDGVPQEVTGREAVSIRLFQKALSGDIKSLTMLREMDEEFDKEVGAIALADEKSSKTDKAILEDFLKKNTREKKGE